VPSIGFGEILILLAIALIVFGPKRLPEMGRTIGRSLREFRRAASEMRAEIEEDLDDEPPRVAGPRRHNVPPDGAPQTGDGEDRAPPDRSSAVD
jgi:sec-independent protein translocase protein TatA